MSQPKRYGFPMCECHATDEAWLSDFGMAELKDGGFVTWDDYAALAAEKDIEIKVLQDEVDCIREENVALAAENAALAAENERLRKLLEMYLKADPLIGEAVASAMLAQKEGKSV